MGKRKQIALMHTDLIEDIICNQDRKVKGEEYSYSGGTVKRLYLNQEDEKVLSKKKGWYSTIFFDELSLQENANSIQEVLEKEISFYMKQFEIKENDFGLVIGLGNRMSTPDSLGPKVIENITVTKHLFDLGLNVELKYRPLSVISPGVMAQTGIETKEYILALIEKIHPTFVIAIDALASNSLERVMKTIQLTDTGIHPGSGIGNHRKEISQETIGIPVLAIGVPTVVDAATIVQNTLSFLSKKLSYQKENKNNPKNKFLTGLEGVYKNQEDTLTKQEKQSLLGELGLLSLEEQTHLFEEVLTPLGYNLMVTPTDVDALIEQLSKIISGSLNHVLHKS